MPSDVAKLSLGTAHDPSVQISNLQMGQAIRLQPLSSENMALHKPAKVLFADAASVGAIWIPWYTMHCCPCASTWGSSRAAGPLFQYIHGVCGHRCKQPRRGRPTIRHSSWHASVAESANLQQANPRLRWVPTVKCTWCACIDLS